MAQNNLINPHDKFFKESFSRREIAESFVREYLPEKLCKHLQLKSLEILKDSYVDKELSEHFSDILYKVRISGKLSYIYLLFEHKSYVDPWTGFQLLRNMVKIWEQFCKQHRKAKKLPIIIPIMIYHGSEKWNIDNSIQPLFEEIDDTREYIPDFRSEIFDISHIPDDKIKGEILLRVHFLIEKYIYRPDLFEKLHEIFGLLTTLSSKKKSTEYLEVLLRYLFATVDSKKADDLRQEIKKSIEQGETIMPTIAEKWIQEGIQEGMEKGMEKKESEIIKKMIDSGMSNAEIRKISGTGLKKIEEIRRKKTK